ncbi:MAG: amidohydrolase family protein [Actinomycetota bacterium]
MSAIVLENARVFDGHDSRGDGMSVLVEDDRIVDVSEGVIDAPGAERIDVGGRTLMPGLIDLHVHAYASDVSAAKINLADAPYRTAHAARMLGHALDCGFTTVRDIGGGDWSLSRAIDDRLIRAPRFFYAGKVLSMTGGHGDMREMGESDHVSGYCRCDSMNALCVIADGVDECLKAVREELRRGAHCIKIMGSGGVASPTDPIWMNQYREDEIRAIVGECEERRTYVAAHCHPASAIRRCVEYGVRCIEHGTLMDAETADFVAEKGAYVVPTLSIGVVLKELGPELGLPPVSQAKLDVVFEQTLVGLEHMRRAGIKIGFGTDLLGATYVQQCREFTTRNQVFSPLEILRQATSMSAEILMKQDELGCIRPGAYADLIVVDGDPLADIELLAADGANLPFIMRAGEIVKHQFPQAV